MRLPRSSGLLLHVTSLPGRFGVGDLGPAAFQFVDLLAETGQRWWQMLPVGPIGAGNSPYQSFSSHAGNVLLISPKALLEEGWIAPADLDAWPDLPADRVDYPAVTREKDRLLRAAFARFDRDRRDFHDFIWNSGAWLDDYSLFMALKQAHAGAIWSSWEPEFVHRDPSALHRIRGELRDDIAFHQFGQFAFARQFGRVRDHARHRGVSLIGDVPIFVALDSADVWSRPELFHLDEYGRPTVVAGVPPDYFSATGQHWGNPLYRWEAHRREGFAWWLARLRTTLSRFDLVRLDHFRGFESYWEIPAEAETAVSGRWVSGPADEFLSAVRAGLDGLPLIAEDLGDISLAVLDLRDRFDLPGMRVLQFGFGDDPKRSAHLPHLYVPHCIAYTGTHDNDTCQGWFSSQHEKGDQPGSEHRSEADYARALLGLHDDEAHWEMIRAVASSVADTSVFPLQDVLGLGAEARMNVPGEPDGNWCWRMKPDAFHPKIRARLAEITSVYGRWNGDPPESLRFPRIVSRPDA